MPIPLGPPPEPPRCFYCGSILMWGDRKCSACNAPVREQSRPPRPPAMASFAIGGISTRRSSVSAPGVSAAEWSAMVECKKALGHAFLGPMKRAIDALRRAM